MNRKRLRISIALLFLLILIGFPVWVVYREMRQARLDHALIKAIKAEDNTEILELLAEGAGGDAQDSDKPPTFREVLMHFQDHFRHSGMSAANQAADDNHLPALLLLFDTDLAKQTQPDSVSGPDLVVVRALLDHGARVNDRETDGRSPLSYASLFDSGDTVSLLLARGADIEAKDMAGQTPLMWANAGVTKILLGHGANIEANDNLGERPLHHAVSSGVADVVGILLEHGANIEAKDRHNRTPLIWAARYDEIGATYLLLKHGAKVSAKDDHGKTALDYVRHDNDPAAPKIAALLRQYGAK